MTLEFLVQVILVGILATYVLLVLALWNAKLGLPRLDFPKAMAALTYGDSFEGQDPPYWAGVTVIYFNGVFFTLLYATYVHQFLPGGTALIQGAIWGVILWAASGILTSPIFVENGRFYGGHGVRNG